MNPKNLIHRSEDYLQWIREQPSIISGSPGPNDPHHVWNSGGKKPNDYLAVPLTRGEHSECHQIGTDSFEEKYNILFEWEIIKLLSKYIGGEPENKGMI